MSQERDRIFFRNFSIVLLVLVLFTIAAAWLANRIGEVQYRQQEEAAAAVRTAPVGAVNTEPVAAAPVAAPEPAPAEPVAASGDPGEAVYRQVCFACHATPALGAPVLGKREDWEPRAAKGVDTLIRHAIEGFQGEKGLMPPKGGRPDLSDEEVAAAVHYMLREAGLEAAAGSGDASAEQPPAATGTAAAAQPAAVAAADGKAAYDSACFVCHTPGAAGAPKLGDSEAWAQRAAKGRETLYRHAIEGFAGDKGVMPPKGGRVDFSDDQVRAAVDYMLSQAGV